MSTMTVMAGATIAPALPSIRTAFAGVENADLLVRLALTMPAIFTAVGAPLAGLLIDRFGRRTLLLVAMALYGVGGAGGGLAPSIGVLLASRAMLGLAVGGVMTTATTLIADYYAGEKRSAVMGHQAAFMSFGGILFLVTGGVLADVSWRAPFAIYLLAFAYVPLAVLYLPEPPLGGAEGRQGRDGTDGPEGAGAGRAHGGGPEAIGGRAGASAEPMPWSLVAMLCALALLVMLVFYMTPVQVPFYLERLGTRSGALIGLAIATTTLTGALAAMAYGRVKTRIGYQGVFAAGFALMAVGNAIVALANAYAPVTAGLAVLGLGLGLLMPNLNNWAGEVAPRAFRGRVLSAVTTFVFLGQFLSPIATQPLVDALGLAGAFAVAAGAVGVLAGLFGVWTVVVGASPAEAGPSAAALP